MKEQDTQIKSNKLPIKKFLRNWRIVRVFDTESSESTEPFFYLMGSAQPDKFSSSDFDIARSAKLLRISNLLDNPDAWFLESVPNTDINPKAVDNEYFILPKEGQNNKDVLLEMMMELDTLTYDLKGMKIHLAKVIEIDSTIQVIKDEAPF